jgi:hypothetical protein
MKSKTRKARKGVASVIEGSGNIFADLGLPNPEQELLKARLTLQIYGILKDSGMTQVEMAKIPGGAATAGLTLDAEPGGELFGWAVEGISYRLAAGRGDHGSSDSQRAWGVVGGFCLT